MYKHTQVSYLMMVVMLVVLALFAYAQVTARFEAPSIDSGANFGITAVMALVLFVLSSFITLSVSVDKDYLRIKFGWGVFRKKFAINEIATVTQVKNHWYYGWGIRLLLRPRIWIFNVSGFDAVEIQMKDKKIYRIGTDAPQELEAAIKQYAER